MNWHIAGNLRVEHRLILDCTRTYVDPERAARIRQLVQQSPDWSVIAREGTLHRILPLVYWTLKDVCPDLVPVPVLATMGDYFQENMRNTLFLKAELRKLLNLFNEHDILVVPYKGLALNAAAYHDLPLRVTTDLDLVVHERDIERSTQALEAHGYIRQKHDEHRHARNGSYRRYFYHEGFQHVESGISVELHWRFMRDPLMLAVKDEYLWERLQPLSLAGMTTVSFAPEDLLLLLCGHGAKHYWPELVLVADVSELIRSHPELDWRQIVKQARIFNVERLLWIGLLLCHELLDADIPGAILHSARADRTATLVTDDILAAFFVDKADRGISDAGWVVRELRLRKRWQDKLIYMAQHIVDWEPNERDLGMIRLPESLFFLYWLLRPIRLAWQYGLKLVKEEVGGSR